jgi:hypothetical protein
MNMKKAGNEISSHYPPSFVTALLHGEAMEGALPVQIFEKLVELN